MPISALKQIIHSNLKSRIIIINVIAYFLIFKSSVSIDKMNCDVWSCIPKQNQRAVSIFIVSIMGFIKF